MFGNASLLITGGTGSFGNALLEKFLKSDIGEIRIFSRDEKKQDDMRRKYSHEKLRFFIGDVRDKTSLVSPLKNVDYVFHAAALKQVPSCEFYPMEAVKTNILGTENLLTQCLESNVKKVVCLSTDKAVYPVNAMGISKAMMEKVAIAKSRIASETDIMVTRYGNVLASRGSVIPLFLKQIMNNDVVTITDPKMTRFVMTLEEAVDLVCFAFEKGNAGDVFVQKSPSATVQNLFEALKSVLALTSVKSKIIGTRHGEKLYEVLLSREERARAEDLGAYFRVAADSRDLNYNNYFNVGDLSISEITDYNSHNTELLNVKQLEKILKGLEILKDFKLKK